MAQRSDKNFTAEYIDQLFSTSASVIPETPPKTETETPPQRQETPEVPETSAKPRKSRTVLILAAITLLAVGFLVGSLLTREEAPPDATTVPTTTVPPQFGLTPSYEDWSTDALAILAAELPILWDTPLTPERFDEFSRQFPLLTALEGRADALDALQKIANNSQSDKNTTAAAQSLIAYISAYVPYVPPCRWLQLEDIHFDIYEFTTAPLITLVPSVLSHETPKAVLQFNADSFVIDGTAAILQEECNFWFLIQRKEYSQAELDTDQFQILSDDEEVPDVRIGFLPCEEGWIVCGYAPTDVSILLNYNTLTTGSFAISVSLPLPESLSTEELLRKTLEISAFQRYLASDPANFQYHPLMAALLEREDLIPTALQITKNDPQGCQSMLMVLLAHESVRERMTVSQKNAFEMLEARQYLSGRILYDRRPALAITGEFSVCDIYYLSSRDAKMIRDTEADHWFFVGLSSGAIELNDGSWSLEIEAQDHSSWYPDSQKANILLWAAYRDNGGQAQCGWLVAVQGKDPCLLRLTLRDGGGNILGADEITWGEMSSVLAES